MVVDDNTLAFLSFNDVNDPWKDECGNNWLTFGNPSANISKTIKYKTSGCSLYCKGASSNIVNYIYLNTLKLGRHDFTIDFWVYLEKLNLGDDRILGTQLSISSTSSNPMRFPFNVGTFQINGVTSCYIPSEYLRTGVWMHRAMVYVYAENTIYYYINGKLIDTATPEKASSYFSSQKYLYINIGCEEAGYLSGAYSNFQGYIDNVRISNCARWTSTSFSTTDMYKFIVNKTIYFKTKLINIKSIILKNLLKYEKRKLIKINFYTRLLNVFNNIIVSKFVYRNVNISYKLIINTKKFHFYINKFKTKQSIHINSSFNIFTYRFIKIDIISILRHFSTCLKYSNGINIKNNTCKYTYITNKLKINTILHKYISYNIFTNIIKNNINIITSNYISKRNIIYNLILNNINYRNILNIITIKYICKRNLISKTIQEQGINTYRNILNTINLSNINYRNILNKINLNNINYRNILNTVFYKYNNYRNIIYNLLANINTVRNINKIYKYNINTIKNILNNINIKNNSNRNIICNSLNNNNINTVRNINKIYKYNINIIKYVNKIYKYNINMIRNINKIYKYNINTIRNILNKLLSYICANTYRNVNKIYKYNINTVKNTLNSIVLHNFNYRNINKIYKYNINTVKNTLNSIVLYNFNYRNILNNVNVMKYIYRNINQNTNINNYLYRYINQKLLFSFSLMRIYTKNGWLTLSHTHVNNIFNVIIKINTQRYVHSHKKPVVAFVTNHKYRLSKNYKTQKQLLEKYKKNIIKGDY